MSFLINLFCAFLTCGIICVIAQIILDNSKLSMGHITSLFVVIGVVLEFFGLYKYIRNFGKMGASIPISSFGSIIMKSVKEMVDIEGFIGIFKGVFSSCGTLLSLAIFLAFIASLFFRAKS